MVAAGGKTVDIQRIAPQFLLNVFLGGNFVARQSAPMLNEHWCHAGHTAIGICQRCWVMHSLIVVSLHHVSMAAEEVCLERT